MPFFSEKSELYSMAPWAEGDGPRSMTVPAFGYAVEVGAADGLELSNTVDLEDQGWTVLCIEPNPIYWPALCRNRKLCMPYACSSRNAEFVEFTSLGALRSDGEMTYTAGSGLDVDIARVSKHSGGDYTKAEREVFHIPQRTLDWCLSVAAFPRVDVVSIDTEGHDLEVLKGFDIVRWAPQFVCIENWDADDAFELWFTDRGYKKQGRDGVNEYYVPK